MQSRLRRLAEAEHARAAELNAVIRAMGDGVIVCGADGRDDPGESGRPPDVPGGRRDELREHPGRSSTTRTATPRAWARTPGRSSSGRAPSPSAGSRSRPIRSRTGRPTASRAARRSSSLRDVTEQRQREAVRETFIGVLSHELRTPVTTIFGGARVLLARRQRSRRGDTSRDPRPMSPRKPSGSSVSSRTSSRMSRFGEADADLGREPVLLQRIVPSGGGVGGGTLAWCRPSTSTCRRASDGHRRPDVSRAGRSETSWPTPRSTAVRAPRSRSSLEYRGERTRSPSASATTARASRLHEAERLFDLFYRSPNTARRRPAPASACSCVPASCGRWVAASGRDRLPAGGAEFGFALRVMRED